MEGRVWVGDLKFGLPEEVLAEALGDEELARGAVRAVGGEARNLLCAF